MTVAQAGRRRDPYPLTWEIPVGVLTTWLLLACLGVHLGRGAANWLAGAGWTWPSGRALFASLPRVLAGDPTAGITTHGAAAEPGAVYGWIITTEILILAATISAALWAWRRWGPERMRGMASPAEAEQILGITRLRRTASIIRPDLHPAADPKEGRHDGYHPAS